MKLNQEIAGKFELWAESKHAKHLRAEDRTHARLTRLENKADSRIGELCRDGETVCYIFPAGGKYREGSRIELTNFLIRNKYVD